MSKMKLIRPTAAENRLINAGIAADPDTYELSEEEFKKLKPALPRGRPKSANAKEHVNLRLDPEVLTFFRSLGRGWQTRLNSTLVKYVSRKKKQLPVRTIRGVYTTDSLSPRRGDKSKTEKAKGEK